MTSERQHALLPLLDDERRRDHLEDARDHYTKTRARLDDLATESRGNKPIHPQYLARLVDELASDDAVFIVNGEVPPGA